MRAIKFRAWSKRRNKWVSPMTNFSFVTADLTTEFKDTEEIAYSQYTGLKDKNGKEIYEGDIVHFKTLRGKEYIGEVKSYEDATSFFVVAKEHYMECLDDVYALKVLGNIYENKELLDE